jgi:hypothetical protein
MLEETVYMLGGVFERGLIDTKVAQERERIEHAARTLLAAVSPGRQPDLRPRSRRGDRGAQRCSVPREDAAARAGACSLRPSHGRADRRRARRRLVPRRLGRGLPAPLRPAGAGVALHLPARGRCSHLRGLAARHGQSDVNARNSCARPTTLRAGAERLSGVEPAKWGQAPISASRA